MYWYDKSVNHVSFEVSKLALGKIDWSRQCEGASSMSRKEKGVQAIVKESCLLAICVHCSAHVLNLVLVKFCAIPVPEIYRTFDFIVDIAHFFKSSSKKMHHLQLRSKA